VIREEDGNFIDFRESQDMLSIASQRNFNVKRLTFEDHASDPFKVARWVQITRGDRECGDIANYKAVGEIKTIQDAMGWEHFIWQCHKMLWTGKYVAVFIRDYVYGRFQMIKTRVMTDESISATEHRIQVKCAKLRIPVFYCATMDDLFNRMEYWLEKCNEAPKPINTYNDHKSKFETPVVMLCGIAGIGEVHARMFLSISKTIGRLALDCEEMDLKGFTAHYSKIKGLKSAYCEKAWRAFHQPVLEDES